MFLALTMDSEAQRGRLAHGVTANLSGGPFLPAYPQGPQPEPASLTLSSLPSSAPEPLLPGCLQPTPAHAGRVLPPCRGRQPGRAGKGHQGRDPPQDCPAGFLGLPAVAERQLHPPSTGTVPPRSESSPVRGHARGILKSKVREEGTGPSQRHRAGWCQGHLAKWGVVLRLEGGGGTRG